MELSPDDIKTIINEPQKAVKLANLVYATEDHLSINRKKVGRGFAYYQGDTKISDKKTLEHIKGLVIPPGWKSVRISSIKNGHIQVVGRDDKERKQYIYHPVWSKIRNQTKFFKMTSFGKVLPKIRKQVEKDLNLKDMPQRKVLALVIRLMEETHIRIGSQYYAKKNKTYGLSTFRTKHVKTFKDGIMFDFIGKKGKEHSITVENRKLVDLINQCEDIPGWELFKFYDDKGKKQRIDSGMINDYIHEISGDMFSAKDFRTWSATKIFFETLREIGYTDNEKDNKKNLIEAFDSAAEGLGNTRAVCRSYYVHPKVIETYENGEIIPYFEKIEDEKTTGYTELSQTEKAIYELIKDYEIEIER